MIFAAWRGEVTYMQLLSGLAFLLPVYRAPAYGVHATSGPRIPAEELGKLPGWIIGSEGPRRSQSSAHVASLVMRLVGKP